MEFEGRMWTPFSCLCLTFLTKVLAISDDAVLIGGMYNAHPSQEQSAFRHALFQNNIHSNTSIQPLNLMAHNENLDHSDSYVLADKFCTLIRRQVYLLVGVTSTSSLPSIKSYSNTFHIPYITPSLSGTEMGTKSSDYLIYMRPSPIPVLAGLIKYHKWDKFNYLYDDTEGLYRLQLLLEVAADRYLDVRPYHLRGVTSVINILNKIRVSGITKTILDTSPPSRTSAILTQALQLGMVTRKYHFVVLDFDVYHIDLENFKYGGANVTGFRMVDETNTRLKEYRDVWNQFTEKYAEFENITYVKFQAALVYDAVSVITEAFRLMKNDHVDIDSELINCDNKHQKPWRDGEKMNNYLKEVDIQGLTGPIRFDKLGRRTNYTMDILSLVPDETGKARFDKVGKWDSSGEGHIGIGSDGEVLSFPADSFNRTLRVTTIDDDPYFMLKKNADEFEGMDKYEGYCVDLMAKIADVLKIKYEWQIVEDGNYGRLNEDTNRWDGMIGELIENKADLVVAPLTITSDREPYVEFTTPFMGLGISIMIKKPQNTKPGVFSFLHPLSHEIWMCIVFAYVGVSVVLFLVSRFSPYEWHAVDAPPPLFDDTGDRQEMANDFGIFNSLWFSLGAFMQQGCDISPRSLSGRIVGGVWWFFTLIIISSYTANLAAFLTVERMVSPIESADDLATQTEISYGTLTSGSTTSFFEKSTVPTYTRMWAYMSTTQPSVFTNSIKEGIERVRRQKGRYAFLLESTMNEYINQRKPCDTIKVGNNLNSRGYGIATRKGSALRENLTLAILTLRERGELHKMEKKWWYEKGECGDGDSKSQETANALSLSNVAGVFYILVGGLGLAMVVALMEFCYKSRKEARRAKTSLSIAMRAKARMSIKGDNGRVSTPDFTKSISTVPITRSSNLRTPPKANSGNMFSRKKSLTPCPSEEDLLAKVKKEEVYLRENVKMLHIEGLDSCNGTNTHTQV